MSRREKFLLLLLGVAGVGYLLSQTTKGQQVTGTLLDKIARVIGGHEGNVLTVYQDEGGLWTVGHGHLVLPTDTVIRNGAPTKLHPYGPVTDLSPAESDAFFARDTEAARSAVANKVSAMLTDNQRAALISLVFNIGTGAFAGSTLLRKLNAGDVSGAADQFLVWKKVKGVDSPGLLARRTSERALFLS